LAPEPDRVETEATKVGDGWLVIPANRGQVLSRVDLYVRGAGPFADAIGKGAATSRIAQLDKQIAGLDAELAKFKQDPSSDPKFIATKQAERDQAMALKQKLVAQPLAVTAAGNFFTFEQIRINKALACSAPVR